MWKYIAYKHVNFSVNKYKRNDLLLKIINPKLSCIEFFFHKNIKEIIKSDIYLLVRPKMPKIRCLLFQIKHF